MEEKQLSFNSEAQTEQKYTFLQMLIFICQKVRKNSDAYNVNQWDLYNSTSDTDIKWISEP